MKNKKINQLTLKEIEKRIEDLYHHDKTLNSQYAKHLIAIKNYLNNL